MIFRKVNYPVYIFYPHMLKKNQQFFIMFVTGINYISCKRICETKVGKEMNDPNTKKVFFLGLQDNKKILLLHRKTKRRGSSAG